MLIMFIVIMVVMMVLMFMLMVVMMMVFVLIIVVIVVIIVMRVMLFYFRYPCSRSGHSIKIEHTSTENLLEIHITIVARYYLSLWLDGTDYLLNTLQFFGSYLRSLIKQDNVTELYLLNDKVLDVFLVTLCSKQRLATTEFILHAQGINDGNDAVKTWYAILTHLLSHAWNRVYCLGNRSRLTDAAGLNNDIIELLELNNVTQLLDKIHLESAADTAILKSYERVILLFYHPTLFYKVGINIHFTYIIYDDSKSDTFFIIKNTIQERCLTTSQITGQK